MGLMMGTLGMGWEGFLGRDFSLGVDDFMGDFLVGDLGELVEET